MTFDEKKAFAQGMSWILAQRDIEKIMLNVHELYGLAMCNGCKQEIDVLKGLCERQSQVENLRERVRYDYGIGMERIIKASVLPINYEDQYGYKV